MAMDKGTAAAQKEQRRPLWITTILKKQIKESVHPNAAASTEGRYHVIQRMISASPNPTFSSAEIQTTLEAFVSPNGEILWRRVAITSIYDSNESENRSKQGLHVSFMLPKHDVADNDLTTSNVKNAPPLFCWAAFSDRPAHKFLCVLVQPNILGIWDVYPDKISTRERADWTVGEGNSVSLPFECCAVFALGDVTGGILLQRKESKEDRNENNALKTWGNSQDEDDSLFVLKDPPRPVRWGKLETSPGSAVSHRLLSTPKAGSIHVPKISSLFTLLHPLDDVLPVSLLSESPSTEFNGTPFTDAFEQILFVDVLRWTEHQDSYCDKKEYFQTICITFNTQLKRHAVWAIKDSPPPPETPPLWQQSRQWRCEDDWCTEFLGPLDQEDLEVLGVGGNNETVVMSISRDDALADALGVRRTPRKGMPEMALPPRNLSTLAVRKSRRHSEGGVSSTILTPSASNLHSKDAIEIDGELQAESVAPPLLSFTALSGLHPRLGLACLLEDESCCDKADRCFLASSLDGSGVLTICLCCPSEDKVNSHELRLFSVTPRRVEASACCSGKHSISVKLVKTISCLSAQPVKATTVPYSFRPHERLRNENYDCMATDILILTKEPMGSTYLTLNRAGTFVVDCALAGLDGDQADMGRGSIIDLLNPVMDHVDFILSHERSESVAIRGEVCLRMAADKLAERVLETVDCTMYSLFVQNGNAQAIEAALMLRADCVRLAQLSCRRSDESSILIVNPCWSAVETVLLSIYKQDLVSSELRRSKRLGKENQDAWYSLIRSEFHKVYDANDSDGIFLGFQDAEPKQDRTEDGMAFLEREMASLNPFVPSAFASADATASTNIFDSLHLLYEDIKLVNSIRSSECLRQLGSFLALVCSLGKRKGEVGGSDVTVLEAFLDYYLRDLGDCGHNRIESHRQRLLRPRPQRIASRKQITTFQRPPSFLAWVDRKFKGEMHNGNYYGECTEADINAACRSTRSLHRVLTTLFTDRTSFHEDPYEADRLRDKTVVLHMIEEQLTDPLWVRDELPVGIAVPLLEVLHRSRCNPDTASSSRLSPSGWLLIGRPDFGANYCSGMSPFTTRASAVIDGQDRDGEGVLEDKDKDGILPIELSSSVLFPDDNRVREVGRLLRSSRPVFLRVHRAVEVTDHDYERMKQSQLLQLCQRVLAQPVGRGMFTLGNLRPVPAEPLPVPNLCLSGRVPPTNATLALDLTEAPADMKMWPEFNNGAAAGLRLPYNRGTRDSADITRSWIVYNKPVNPTQAQNEGGNAAGQPNNAVNLGHAHGGLLMALGLRGHLATLNVADIYDLLAHGSTTTTVGVLLGLAANKRGSCDISVSKMLCLHIPTLIPQHFSGSIDVASPVQAAAVAGAGLLFQGSSHRMMTEFFLNELGRRPESDVHVDRDAYTLSCGLALGMINLCQGESIREGGKAGLADLRIEERLHRYVVGGVDDDEMRKRRETSDRFSVPSMASGETDKCSRIFEGDTINTDISAPGATLALGLMYMKSGSKTMAACLALPDTHFLLEYVRPDFLMLRVISRSLILWDEVLPTRSWINSQIPTVVLAAYNAMRESVENVANFADLSLRNSTAGRSSNSELRLGTASFDRQSVRQIYNHVIAGACFGLGLRYAGTGDKNAALAITECLKELRCLRDENDPISVALRPERQVLEMCLSCVTISLALVLAGSGDLNALRLFKILRWRCDDKVTYGTHMAYSAAIGLLFLGGGTCTVGREPEDIAVLVMSFFPRFPSSSSDNLFHLQAFRHLYALAVKERELRAIDVDTKESVFVPIEVHFENEDVEPLQLQSPCLLMNTDETPKELRLISERYYPVRLPMTEFRTGRWFFVKKKSSSLIKLRGPRVDRLFRNCHEPLGVDENLGMLKYNDPQILAFANNFCAVWGKTKCPLSVFEFCSRALQECLAANAEEALPLYLSLLSAVLSMEHGVLSTTSWDMRLIKAYYERRHYFVSDSSSPWILNQQLVASLIEIFERRLVVACEHDDLTAYFSTQLTRDVNSVGQRKLGKVLTYFDMPPPRDGVDLGVDMDTR